MAVDLKRCNTYRAPSRQVSAEGHSCHSRRTEKAEKQDSPKERLKTSQREEAKPPESSESILWRLRRDDYKDPREKQSIRLNQFLKTLPMRSELFGALDLLSQREIYVPPFPQTPIQRKQIKIKGSMQANFFQICYSISICSILNFSSAIPRQQA